MNSNKIMDAMNELNDELIQAASGTAGQASLTSFRKRMPLVAACLFFALLLTAGGLLLFGGKGEDAFLTPPKAMASTLASPQYPAQMQWKDYYNNATANQPDPIWDLKTANHGAAEDFRPFFAEIMLSLLAEESEENLVMSPVNIFMATAMLGEITAGETRQEILNALHMKDMNQLRAQAKKVWELAFYDNGVEKSIPANSLWLSNEQEYGAAAVQTLARDYYASVFSGRMGSQEYTTLFRNWLNEQTGGLLKEQVDQLSLNPGDGFHLISTLYYQSKWTVPFLEEENQELIFHGSGGDKTVTFLHADEYLHSYYYGDRFIAVCLPTFQGRLWLFLPDEGVSLQEMMGEEAFRAFLSEAYNSKNYIDESSLNTEQILYRSYNGMTHSEYTKVNLSIPKLDISAGQDLIESLQSLGIRRAFDGSLADFSPLSPGAFLQRAEQSSRLILDEEGISAASYVDYSYGAALPPDEEVNIVFDRPFFFLIQGNYDSIPLFAGVVNDP